MFEYLDDQQERFFTWCDKAVQDQTNRAGTILKRCWPRKNPDGSYELVLLMAAQDKVASKYYVPIPEEFHELLEREYFINHPPEGEEEIPVQ
ncbi:MAG: hypothetical protein A4E53_00975 [Pelotomaculum sp. PtaB.Bin104]|nr:MAG: hypothetical protein A4E53_00975 [Pelotomaculum sp. PtaB.Bin104]